MTKSDKSDSTDDLKSKIISDDAPKIKPYPMFMSTRFGVSLLGFFGCVMVCALRVNVGFAVVCMVNNTAVQIEEGVYNESHAKLHKPEVEGSLVWRKDLQGLVVGSFYWGYAISQVAGGYVASRIGGRVVIGVVVIGSSILNFMYPFAAEYSVYAFITVRFVLGIVQGAVLPAFHTFFSTWAPPLERGFLVSLTLAGINAGMILTMPVSGFLCKYGFAGGWPSIFYVFGIMGIVWAAAWFVCSSDMPSDNRFIKEEEASYIEASLADVTTAASEGTPEKKRIPWAAILTSIPVYATFAGHLAGDWGAYMMQNCLPMFLSDNLGFPPSSLGTITAIPYVFYLVAINVGGILADKATNSGLLSTLNVRRICTGGAILTHAVFLLAASYCGPDQAIWAIVFITIGTGISAIQYSGYVVSYLDLAPAYAGILYGIGNTISSLCGFGTPWLVGILTPKGQQEEWQLVFWISLVIMVTGVTIYVIFESGDVQPWALADYNQVKDEETCTALKEMNPVLTVNPSSKGELLGSAEKIDRR